MSDALQEVAAARWRNYVQNFVPAEKRAIENARVTQGELAAAEGGVAGDAAAAFAGLERGVASTVGATTGGVSSGASKLALAAGIRDQSSASGQGRALARQGAQEQELYDMIKLVGFGEGVATDTVDSLADASRRATSLSIAKARARADANAMRMEGLGTAAGAALRYSKLGQRIADRDTPSTTMNKTEQPELYLPTTKQSQNWAVPGWWS